LENGIQVESMELFVIAQQIGISGDSSSMGKEKVSEKKRMKMN
jgi:hypothetical protein